MLSHLGNKLFRHQIPAVGPPPGGFVDVHAHVIPTVDDGAKSWDETMAIMRNAAASGTSLLVATPHGDSRGKWHNIQELRDGVTAINARCGAEHLSINVVLGMENPLERGLVGRLEAGTALCLNSSRYLLVEFPYTQLPLDWEQVLFQLQLAGKVPIIVHPERQPAFQKNPALLEGAIQRGNLVQITAGSLAAKFGSEVRKTAEELLKQGLVHILASDTHAPQGPRGPSMLEGYAAAVRLIGTARAARMASTFPRSLVTETVQTGPA